MPFLLLFNVFYACSLSLSVTPAMSLDADSAAESDRLEAARELVKVLFKPSEEVRKTPVVPEKPGAGKTVERMFLDLANQSREFSLRFGFEPATDEARERRTEITAIFLARRFSTSELTTITAYIRTGIDEKIQNISLLSAGETIAKCGQNPSFELDLDQNADPEKIAAARKIVTDLNFSGSTLPLLACGSLIMENKLARELTIEELNAAFAFATSEAGRKYGKLNVNGDRSR
jgi:hypothetical protein